MFHDGDLQSGISRAIAEQKLVGLFIRQNDNEESQRWEEKWLSRRQDLAVVDLFATKAVLMKIEYQSQEMGFLSAFCPITKAPTFVVIDKGQVLEKIEGGVSQQEFVERISKALSLEMYTMRKSDLEFMRSNALTPENAGSSSAAAGAASTDSTAQTETPSESGIATPASQDLPEPSISTSSSAQQDQAISNREPAPASMHTTNDMSSLFPNRAERLEAEKLKREAAEKAERTARANARRKEAEAAASSKSDKGKGKATESSEKEKARRDWLVQQKQRKDEAKQERERILAQIEADKQERKSRFQRPQTEAASSPLLSPSVDAASKRRTGAGGMCSLLIRLFDGSSIKGRFEPSATLAGTVRDWIKITTAEQGNTNAADIPFTFKQIMAPQPSRNIEISEEHQSLAELGLTPNATLVLAPVAGYTEAYSSGGRGYMSSALHYTYALANGATSMLGSALSYVPGFGAAGTDTLTSSRETSSDESVGFGSDGTSDRTSSIKVKTLADQRAEAAKKDQSAEFYNGNSSAFEGRKDDDEGKK
ncbi:UBX domain-containing protein 6 [Pseudocercospora fuligena]|uniref:UBX domain-containing protein 2 n=1 Tax=Pseudocercospora fuligena TaxID=685502 RepID=A0A8H6RTZ4_9PEZI|nr:UBX domain-containing protein 6 [Pseudocercospora fuligena]